MDVTPRASVVTVTWNGAVIDRRTVTATGDLDLTYTLPSRNSGHNELLVATDQTIHPKDDARELGLSLHGISWTEPRTAARLQ